LVVIMKRCKQCRKEKAESDFLRLRKPGWRVVKCNDCATANMAKYWRGVNKDPNKVGRMNVDD